MKCPRCQYENPPGSNFCLGCGTHVDATCGACGNDLPAGSRFCNKCGTPVSGQSTGQVRFASPESYTPKHLAERILTSKSALEGERKQVTVLFADLKGSMELLADRDPEEARKILDPVLELMMEAVHRYEGTVNQVMGDGIMALFGAPLAHEDHAVRACYAGLRMQQTVKRYAEDARRAHGVNVQIRVGLNSGEVVVRAIGSDLHMDYTAVGQTTHLAARMEQFASPGNILMTPATLTLVEGYVEVKRLGPIPVKGLASAVEVYELTGGGPVRTRFQAAARRGLTRFVGREAEVEQLRHALERAGAGRGQVVAIVGEAGVGKSRLFYEFTHSHRVQGWLILESGSVSYGKATVYLPVIDLLKSYFKIQDRDDHREIREKVIGRMLGLDRSLEALLPPVLALLDVSVDDPGWESLDPHQRRQRTLDAIKRLLLRESQVQPLLLVFEDLHWIDSETQALLDSLVDSLGSVHVLLLVNYRPEYEHRWAKKTYYTQLRLDSLPPESTSELLRALLGEAAELAPLKEMLRKRGNPFFLEESVRTLVETSALEGARGAYRLVRPVQSLQIPGTVQAILAARIDRLPVEEKQLLQTASVIGKDVPYGVLAAIADSHEAALRRALGHLQEGEFLYETSLFPDLEYTFKHALTHDVTYGSLLQDRRRTVHAKIVDVIKNLYSDRLVEHVERLAHHAVRGEAWADAVAYGRQAGAKALARSANREAAAYFKQALVGLAQLPQTGETSELAIDLRIDLQTALYTLGDLAQSLDCLSEAEALAQALGDQRRLAQASAHRTLYLWLMGDMDRGIEAGERALATASATGEFGLEILAGLRLGQAYYFVGAYRRARDILARAVEALREGPALACFSMAYFPSVACLGYLSWCRAALGDFTTARRTAEEGLRLAQAVGQPYSLAVAWWGVGQLHLMQGNFSEAISSLEHGLEICKRGDFILAWAFTAAALGEAYALAQRPIEAITLLHEAGEQSAAVRATTIHSINLTALSEAYLLGDRLSDAAQSVQRALELCRAYKLRGLEAGALRIFGAIYASQTPPDVAKAEDYYRQALDLAGELGHRPLMAHCLLGLGKVYRRTGKREQAQEHLAEAKTMYREMDMRFWPEQAEAEMKELA